MLTNTIFADKLKRSAPLLFPCSQGIPLLLGEHSKEEYVQTIA
jgi:hypothetical protein